VAAVQTQFVIDSATRACASTVNSELSVVAPRKARDGGDQGAFFDIDNMIFILPSAAAAAQSFAAMIAPSPRDC